MLSELPVGLVLLSGMAHKPQDVGFDVGEPGNGADRPVEPWSGKLGRGC